MISVSGLSKSYADQLLFEGVSLQFHPGERYGVVGANGSGKSTLLRILSGDASPSRGEVSVPRRTRLGVLRQDHFRYERERILDVVMMGHGELWRAMVEKASVLERAEERFDAERYAALEEIVMRHDGYGLEARAGEILEGLGIPSGVHAEPLSTLSGGFKLRALLAQVLASRPDVLLLDEPTNHLDIQSIRWLEKFLGGHPGTSLVVSHDHRFLDNVATHILDVDYATITGYRGNYQRFKGAKAAERERREREIQKRQKEIADHKAFVDRFRAKASKARQAQSKLKQIQRIEIEELPPSSRRTPGFRFRQSRPSGRQVLDLRGVGKSYGEAVVLDDVSLRVMRGERVAIIGPNGIGKSTLLKIAMGQVTPDAGEVEWGYEAHPGWFAQDHREQLADEGLTALQWLWNACPGETPGFVRGHLGAVLLSGDDVDKKIGALSGGEGARLIFARQAVEQPNVMVLDEPTNHLDLEAIEGLVEGLNAYDGTLLFVSHDRWFVGELATRIVEISPAGIRDFAGSYAEYIERCGDDHLDSEAVLRRHREERRAARPGRGSDAPESGTATGEREARRRRKAGEKRLEEVTAELQAAEARLAEIHERFAEPAFYADAPRREVRALETEQGRLRERIEVLMREWEQLETGLQES